MPRAAGSPDAARISPPVASRRWTERSVPRGVKASGAVSAAPNTPFTAPPSVPLAHMPTPVSARLDRISTMPMPMKSATDAQADPSSPRLYMRLDVRLSSVPA